MENYKNTYTDLVDDGPACGSVPNILRLVKVRTFAKKKKNNPSYFINYTDVVQFLSIFRSESYRVCYSWMYIIHIFIHNVDKHSHTFRISTDLPTGRFVTVISTDSVRVTEFRS